MLASALVIVMSSSAPSDWVPAVHDLALVNMPVAPRVYDLKKRSGFMKTVTQVFEAFVGDKKYALSVTPMPSMAAVAPDAWKMNKAKSGLLEAENCSESGWSSVSRNGFEGRRIQCQRRNASGELTAEGVGEFYLHRGALVSLLVIGPPSPATTETDASFFDSFRLR